MKGVLLTRSSVEGCTDYKLVVKGVFPFMLCDGEEFVDRLSLMKSIRMVIDFRLFLRFCESSFC